MSIQHQIVTQLRRCGVLLAAGFAVMNVAQAEPDLYETGPAQDASFIRFVNATDQVVTITTAKQSGNGVKNSQAGGATLTLSTQPNERASSFYSVKAGAKLSANIAIAGSKTPLQADVQAKPSEYVTVVVVPTVAAKSARNTATYAVQTLKEMPDDFSAVRASMALFNVHSQCATVDLVATPKNTPIVAQLKPNTVQRRLLNPVNLSVQVMCASQPATSVAAPIVLGQLQAGERYSVFVAPSSASATASASPLIFNVRDAQR